MEIIGYLASIFIGISIGLIGTGSGTLTIPALIYLFGVDVVPATAYALFIGGLTSAVGSISYIRNKLIHIKTVISFGLSSIIGVLFTRSYIIPNIPENIMNINGIVVTKDLFIITFFAILMSIASYSMIKKTKESEVKEHRKLKINYPLIAIEGLIVGIITGLVGTGGGFLIVPTLVILLKLPMKEAVGTTLLIIAAKSLIGFLGEPNIAGMDWKLLISVVSCTISGVLIGTFLSRRIDGRKLKPFFGWVLLILGICIIIKEVLLNRILAA